MQRRRISGWLITNKLEGLLNETLVVYFTLVMRLCLGRLSESTRNLSGQKVYRANFNVHK